MSTSSFATYRLVRALRLQKEELGDDQGGHLVIHGAVHEHDSLLQQPGVQVESPLSAVGALQDHGDHIEGAGLLLRGLGDAAQAARQQLLRQLAQVSAHRLQTLFPRAVVVVVAAPRRKDLTRFQRYFGCGKRRSCF